MILNADYKNILKAADVIKTGGLVAFPTETVYGLGANGLDPISVAKIFDAKKRPTFNPLILHVSDEKMLESIAFFNQDIIKTIIEKFWPGPLTLILPKKEIVPDIVTAGHPTVAVRMPAHPVALKLIELAGTPVAAPSANKFSQLSPTQADHVEKQLGREIDIILDGGSSDVGVESTIIQIENENIFLLRPGGLAVEELEEFLNKKLIIKQGVSENPNSPGQLYYHYSPNVEFKLIGDFDHSEIPQKRTGAIFFTNKNLDYNFEVIKILSPSGSMTEAAANLFKYLHEMEQYNLDMIIAEKIPEDGLGMAIMDRLKKAANKYL